MSFTPGSALHPALNLALLLETKKHCCYKHFSSPQSRHFHPQTLQQQAARFRSSERRRLSSLGPKPAMPWSHPGRTDSAQAAWRQGLPQDGWKEGDPRASGACGRDPTPAGMAHAPLALPGGLLSPGHPTQTPAGCSPSPHPYLCPLIWHVLLKQEGFSLRLHCEEGNCFCHCSPKGCAFLRQLDLYRTSLCRDKVC